MRMLVRDEAKAVPKKEVRFWLEQNDNGVMVKAKLGSEGWPWSLLQFNNDGSVHRIRGVGSELEIDRDEDGKVNIK